jgi:hypothetical protein
MNLPAASHGVSIDNYLDIIAGGLYDLHKFAVFLVVTKNHVSPGIIRGFFYLNTERRY